MARLALLVAALVAPLAFAVPTPGNVYGTGGSAPAGYDASVENFCSAPEVLQCCDQAIGSVATLPDATATGCKSALFPELVCLTPANHPASIGVNAMAGGEVTYEFGFCPTDKIPLCCAIIVSSLAHA